MQALWGISDEPDNHIKVVSANGIACVISGSVSICTFSTVCTSNASKQAVPSTRETIIILQLSRRILCLFPLFFLFPLSHLPPSVLKTANEKLSEAAEASVMRLQRAACKTLSTLAEDHATRIAAQDGTQEKKSPEEQQKYRDAVTAHKCIIVDKGGINHIVRSLKVNSNARCTHAKVKPLNDAVIVQKVN
jgi:hypothetical protein